MGKNYRIPLFCLVTSLYWFSLYTYVPTLSAYSQSLGASYKLIGLIIGSYGFTQMLLRIPLGIISDTLNKRKIFVTLGVVIALICGLGLWFFRNAGAVLVFRGLSGAAAATWVTYTVLFSSYFDSSEAPKAIGIISAFCSLGQMIAIFFGGLVAQRFGPQAPFLLAAAGAAVAIILSFGIVETRAFHREPMKLSNLLSVARNFNFLVVAAVAIFAQFVTFATVYGFTPLAARNIGATDFELGLLTSISTLPGIFASILSGTFFTKHFGERKSIFWGFMVTAASCAVIPYIGNIFVLYTTQVIGGFGWGLVFPLLMSLSIKNVEESKRATAMGFFQAIYGIGMFTGPVIVGALNDAGGLTLGFWATAIIAVAGGLIVLLLKEGRTKKPVEE